MQEKNLKINKLAIAAGLCTLFSISFAQASSVDIFTDKNYEATITDLGGAKLEKNVTTVDGRAVDAQIKMGANKQYYTIQWDKMNVPKNKVLDYEFSKTGQVSLNKINGNSLTKIGGSITSSGENGRIIISNSNGILLENGSYINANSVMLTTHDVSIDEKKGQFDLNKKVGADGNYHGVVVGKSDINLGKDFVIASTGIKIQGADIFAGENITLITSDGAKFIPQGKGKKSEQQGFSVGQSTAALTVAPNQVYYNGRASSGKYNNNIMITRGSGKANTAIQMPDGKIHMIADGAESKIAIAYMDHQVDEKLTGSDNQKNDYLHSSDRGVLVQANNVHVSNTETNARLQIDAAGNVDVRNVSAKRVQTAQDAPPTKFYARGVNADWIAVNGTKSLSKDSSVTVANSNVVRLETKINGATVGVKDVNISDSLAVEGASKVTLYKVNNSDEVAALNSADIKDVDMLKISNSKINTVDANKVNNLYASNLKSYKLESKGDVDKLQVAGASEIANLNSEAKNVYISGAKLDTVELNPSQDGGKIRFGKILALRDDKRVTLINKVGKANSISIASAKDSGVNLNINSLNAAQNIALNTDGNINIAKGKTLTSEVGRISLVANGDVSLAHLNAGRDIVINANNISSQTDSSMTTHQRNIVLNANDTVDVHSLNSARDIKATGMKLIEIDDFTTVDRKGVIGNGMTTLVSEDVDNIAYSGANSNMRINQYVAPQPPEPENPVEPPVEVEPELPVEPEVPVDPPVVVEPEVPVEPEIPVEPPVVVEPEPIPVDPPKTIGEMILDKIINVQKGKDASNEVQKIVSIKPPVEAIQDEFKSSSSLLDKFRENLKSFAAFGKQEEVNSKFKIIKTEKGFRILN